MENNILNSVNQLNSLATGAIDFMNSLRSEIDKIRKDPNLTPEQKEIVEKEWKKANFEGERDKLTKALEGLNSLIK